MLDFLHSVVYAMRNREDGQALVEYALILALVSVVAIGILTTLGGNIVTTLTSVAGAL
jgi:pilus assembly protein Flp/PilA